MDGFECEQKNFCIVDAGFDREPVELLQDRSDVVDGGGPGYDAGS